MSPRSIHRPSSQLIVPSHLRPPHGWSGTGPFVAHRMDMSFAQQWYKLEDLADPLVNDGLRGVGLNLDYVAGDGAPTYGAAGGLFGGVCLEMSAATAKCIEWNRQDAADAPFFGDHVSIWAWHTPVDVGAGKLPQIWGRHGYFDSGGNFILGVGTDQKAVAYVTYTSLQTSFKSAAIVTWGVPHLFGLTHDGATSRLYLDGIEVAHYDQAEPIVCAGTGGWSLGCWNTASYRHSAGKYHEAGFDDTVFSAADMLTMYHAGMP